MSMSIRYARVVIKDEPACKNAMFTQPDYKAPRVKK